MKILLFVASLIFITEVFSVEHKRDQDKIVILVESHVAGNIENNKCTSFLGFMQENLPYYDFEIIISPAADSEIYYNKVKNNKIDFLISNPVSVIELQRMYGLNPLLTKKRSSGINEFGAVFFTSSSSGINEFNIAGDLSLSASFKTGTTWLLAVDYVRDLGGRMASSFSRISFLGDPQKVIHSVLSNALDVGVVRSGVIESMIASGEINEEDVVFLNPMDSLELGFEVTTRLVPEWIFSATKDVDPKIVEEIKSTISRYPHSNGVTQWGAVSNYEPVREVLRKNRMGLYKDPDHVKFYRENYLFILGIVFFGLSIFLYRKNKVDNRLLKYKIELERLSRNSSLNRLLAEIAHELSQPITSIKIDSEMIKELSHEKGDLNGDDLREVAESMSVKTQLCVEIIANIRNFLVRKEVSASMFNLSDSINKVLELLSRDLLSSDIRTTLKNISKEESVFMSSIEFEQVLLNLLKNSISVIKDNDKNDNRITFSLVRDDVFVYLSVLDTGGKILNVKSLFELFKSNKKANSEEGFGLGLNLSRNILRTSDGDLYLGSTSDNGSEFVLKIPRVKRS